MCAAERRCDVLRLTKKPIPPPPVPVWSRLVGVSLEKIAASKVCAVAMWLGARYQTSVGSDGSRTLLATGGRSRSSFERQFWRQDRQSKISLLRTYGLRYDTLERAGRRIWGRLTLVWADTDSALGDRQVGDAYRKDEVMPRQATKLVVRMCRLSPIPCHRSDTRPVAGRPDFRSPSVPHSPQSNLDFLTSSYE